jgi:hypothetical protein
LGTNSQQVYTPTTGGPWGPGTTTLPIQSFTPNFACPVGSSINDAAEFQRFALNDWIRGAPAGVDGAVDFDTAIALSKGSPVPWARYISPSDNLHPMRSGYQAMADYFTVV